MMPRRMRLMARRLPQPGLPGEEGTDLRSVPGCFHKCAKGGACATGEPCGLMRPTEGNQRQMRRQSQWNCGGTRVHRRARAALRTHAQWQGSVIDGGDAVV